MRYWKWIVPAVAVALMMFFLGQMLERRERLADVTEVIDLANRRVADKERYIAGLQEDYTLCWKELDSLKALRASRGIR